MTMAVQMPMELLPVTALSSVALLFVLAMVIALCCFKLPSSVPESPLADDEESRRRLRDMERIKEGEEERRRTLELVTNHLEAQTAFRVKKVLRNLGRRLQKYWIEVYRMDDPEQPLILTAAPKSKNCTLSLDNPETMDILNLLLKEVNKHPCVHNIVEVLHIAEADIVVTIQEAVRQGSLKDIIHRTEGPQDSERDFDVSWSEKDMSIGSTLDVQQMALYGKQILKALRFFKQKKFPPLTHAHTANIFVIDGVCKISGHENTLFGYKSRLHRDCVQSDLLEYSDVIMFGHVMFEMATGLEAVELILTDTDYGSIENESVKKILTYIFTMENGRLKYSIKQIKDHSFFKQVKYKDKVRKFKMSDVHLSKDMETFLKSL